MCIGSNPRCPVLLWYPYRTLVVANWTFLLPTKADDGASCLVRTIYFRLYYVLWLNSIYNYNMLINRENHKNTISAKYIVMSFEQWLPPERIFPLTCNRAGILYITYIIRVYAHAIIALNTWQLQRCVGVPIIIRVWSTI